MDFNILGSIVVKILPKLLNLFQYLFGLLVLINNDASDYGRPVKAYGKYNTVALYLSNIWSKVFLVFLM